MPVDSEVAETPKNAEERASQTDASDGPSSQPHSMAPLPRFFGPEIAAAHKLGEPFQPSQAWFSATQKPSKVATGVKLKPSALRVPASTFSFQLDPKQGLLSSYPPADPALHSKEPEPDSTDFMEVDRRTEAIPVLQLSNVRNAKLVPLLATSAISQAVEHGPRERLPPQPPLHKKLCPLQSTVSASHMTSVSTLPAAESVELETHAALATLPVASTLTDFYVTQDDLSNHQRSSTLFSEELGGSIPGSSRGGPSSIAPPSPSSTALSSTPVPTSPTPAPTSPSSTPTPKLTSSFPTSVHVPMSTPVATPSPHIPSRAPVSFGSPLRGPSIFFAHRPPLSFRPFGLPTLPRSASPRNSSPPSNNSPHAPLSPLSRDNIGPLEALTPSRHPVPTQPSLLSPCGPAQPSLDSSSSPRNPPAPPTGLPQSSLQSSQSEKSRRQKRTKQQSNDSGLLDTTSILGKRKEPPREWSRSRTIQFGEKIKSLPERNKPTMIEPASVPESNGGYEENDDTERQKKRTRSYTADLRRKQAPPLPSKPTGKVPPRLLCFNFPSEHQDPAPSGSSHARGGPEGWREKDTDSMLEDDEEM
ncbi:hypothetical protein DL96DRAFT_1711790 [Flagelloscypha sp. PMI_526]|nr:hypothetical protein DL96DRAFT_1711790 [Flagelloscypha sp. PMI_526]